MSLEEKTMLRGHRILQWVKKTRKLVLRIKWSEIRIMLKETRIPKLEIKIQPLEQRITCSEIKTL